MTTNHGDLATLRRQRQCGGDSLREAHSVIQNATIVAIYKRTRYKPGGSWSASPDLLSTTTHQPITTRFHAAFMHLHPFIFSFFVLYMLDALVYAAQLTDEGEGEITGYPGTSYIAHNYRPICGLLAESQLDDPLSIGEGECDAAMSQFQDIGDTFALYDPISGERQSDSLSIAADVDLCMCFALSDVNERQADICILVLSDGTTRDVDGGDGESAVVVGRYQLGFKSLSHCDDVDVETIISSIDAAGDATHVQVEPTDDTSGEDPSQTDPSESDPRSTSSVSLIPPNFPTLTPS
jgi:hypothetical protein